MALNIKPKSMNDAIGGTVIIGDWVAFSTGIHGKLSIGKINKFNDCSMIVYRRKGKALRKQSTQVIKITDEQVMLHMFTEN
jgi:hypothetical protein